MKSGMLRRGEENNKGLVGKPTSPLCDVAEREGFEPSVEYNPHTRLAGEHHRPLGHLSE